MDLGPHAARLARDAIEPDESPARTRAARSGALRDVLGFNIRQAHSAVYRHFVETFADLGLTQKQVAVLWLIGDNPGIAQIDLGRRLRMDRATTMNSVNRLSAPGFVRRGPPPGSRKRQSLFLTEAGEAILVRARQAIWEHEAWLKGRYTPDEIATLMALLGRIHDEGRQSETA